MVPLLLRPFVFFPGRGAQRIQHPAEHFGALRGQVPVHHPGPAERGRQLHAPVGEVPAWVLVGQVAAGPLVHLGEQRGQLLDPQARGRSGQQQLI